MAVQTIESSLDKSLERHILKASLYLDPIPTELRGLAVDAVLEHDPVGFLCRADNTRSLELVYHNSDVLLEHGIYEVALIHALSISRTNNAHFPLLLLKELIAIGDRAKLLAAGDPLPHGGPFTLFRGVAGTGKLRRVRGIHWTSGRGRAEWFANRFAGHLVDPAVYMAVVPARDIVAHINDRGEDEYIALIPRSLNLVCLEQAAEVALI